MWLQYSSQIPCRFIHGVIYLQFLFRYIINSSIHSSIYNLFVYLFNDAFNFPSFILDIFACITYSLPNTEVKYTHTHIQVNHPNFISRSRNGLMTPFIHMVMMYRGCEWNGGDVWRGGRKKIKIRKSSQAPFAQYQNIQRQNKGLCTVSRWSKWDSISRAWMEVNPSC